MKLRKFGYLLLPMVLCVGLRAVVYAQPYLGIKAGSNVGFAHYRNSDYLKDNDYQVRPVIGFQAGLVFKYVVTKNWGIQAELSYSRRGRELRRDTGLYVNDRLSYDFLELPVLFRFTLGGEKFRFYVNAGPNFSYFLGGRGVFSSAVLRRGLADFPGEGALGLGGPDILKYRLVESATDGNDGAVVEVSELNRIQVGIDVGFGFVLPVIDQRKQFMLDIRYTHMQSFIGRNDAKSLAASREVLRGFAQSFEGASRALTITLSFVVSLGDSYIAN